MEDKKRCSCWLTHLKQNSDLETIKKQVPEFLLFTTPRNCRDVSKEEFENCGKTYPIYHMHTFEDSSIIKNLGIRPECMTIMFFRNGKCLVQGESFVEFDSKMKKALMTNDFSEGLDKTKWLKSDTDEYMKKLHHTVNEIKKRNEGVFDERIEDWMDGL